MKNIVSIILLFLISQSLLGDIRLRAPFPDNNYNHYKGLHVSCISDEFNSRHSKVSITGHNETYYSKMVNYNHYTQVNTQTYSLYSPFKEKRFINIGTSCFDLVLPIDGRINNRNSSEIPSNRHNLLIGNRHYNFSLLADGSIDNAIIQTNTSNTPFEERESINITSKKNAFAPPTEGYESPINDAVLPLLMFAFIYLVLLQFKPVLRD